MNKFCVPVLPLAYINTHFPHLFIAQMVKQLFHMINSIKLFIGFVGGLFWGETSDAMPCLLATTTDAVDAHDDNETW